MIFANDKITIKTKDPIQLIDITESVTSYLDQKRFTNGFLNIMSKHTTATICLNESCEALDKDLKKLLEQVADPKADYAHNKVAVDARPNAHSHLLSYLLGGTQTVPVVDGKLILGTWQKIFFVELDGPRNERQYVLSFMGETHGSS